MCYQFALEEALCYNNCDIMTKLYADVTDIGEYIHINTFV